MNFILKKSNHNKTCLKKKITYNVGELFENLTFDGNQKLDCENTDKTM